jgi:outer membrane receptor protein involved in Fe transport
MAATIGLLLFATAPAMADPDPAGATGQETGTGNALEEIVVTARKREESIMQAPVLVQVLTDQQVEDLHLTSVASLQTVVPQLKISPAFGLSSAAVSLRGIGNGNEATYMDQSVSLELDGMSFSSGMMYKQGLFDVGQITVLKGPQSLFYGKSSSGGVIAIQSADPTKEWESEFTAGYEFNAQEKDFGGYISGPINEYVGVRIAGYYNTSNGYLYNPNPYNTAHRVPAIDQNGLRATIKFDNPDVGLRVRFKAGTTHDSYNGYNVELQEQICPGPVNPITGFAPYSPCKIGKVTEGIPPGLPYSATANFAPFLFTPTGLASNPAFASFAPTPDFGNGKSYDYTNTDLVTLNIDYDITPALTVSSVTGYDYGENADVGANYNVAIGLNLLGTDNQVQDFSQELRLTSNWKSWFNFMVGGLYTSQDRRTHLVVVEPEIPGFLFGLPIPTLGLYTDDSEHLKGINDSVYAQILLTPIEHWELSAGARYTHNSKEFVSLIAGGNNQDLNVIFPPAFQIPPGGQGIQYIPDDRRSYSQNYTTPEFTLSYKPNDDITAFLSFKKGYKGIGYNSNPATPSYAVNNPLSTNYNNVVPVAGETVKGGEGGIKAQLLDHRLAVTGTLYYYNYDNLQVSFIDAAANRATINNGANARVQGVELGADYSVFRGFVVNAFLNYNDSYYTSFPFAGCYSGQTAAQGCVGSTALGQLGSQNLEGHPLIGAPKVAGTLGGTYTANINENYMASIAATATYSSSYYPSPEENPLSKQGAYGLLDIAAHLTKSDHTWDLALICRNCTDKYYIIFGNDAGTTLTGEAAGTNVLIDRPRQVLLQLTVRPKL